MSNVPCRKICLKISPNYRGRQKEKNKQLSGVKHCGEKRGCLLPLGSEFLKPKARRNSRFHYSIAYGFLWILSL